MMAWLRCRAVTTCAKSYGGGGESRSKSSSKPQVGRDRCYAGISELRSTMPRSALISLTVVSSRLSHPYSSHFSKLIFGADYKYFLSFQYGIQKMIAQKKLPLEFFG